MCGRPRKLDMRGLIIFVSLIYASDRQEHRHVPVEGHERPRLSFFED